MTTPHGPDTRALSSFGKERLPDVLDILIAAGHVGAELRSLPEECRRHVCEKLADLVKVSREAQAEMGPFGVIVIETIVSACMDEWYVTHAVETLTGRR